MFETQYFSLEKLSRKKGQKEMARCVVDAALSLDKYCDEVVVVCIGTDRSTGDSFGPLTGHLLRA